MKRAVVTGASHGIGQEVARLLVNAGWDVIGVSRRLCEVQGVRAYSLDVGLAHHVNRLDWIVGGTLDALVHCAAIQGPIGPLTENDPHDWLEAVRTNLLGTYNVVRGCLPMLQQSEDGRILLFAGGGAFGPRENYSAYAVSKSGVIGLVETLGDELRHSTVSINGVSPGFVPTGIDPRAVMLPHDPDGSVAMARAVACVRHLLSPQTYGLTGRTISAEYDAWEQITPMTVASVNASNQGRRFRHPIQRVTELARSSSSVVA